MANKPTTEWDEGNPAGSQEKSLGATRLREVRTQLREMIGEDHKFDSSGQDADWGYHEKCTLYVQSSDPIPDASTGNLYSKDVNDKAELYWVDESDNAIQITSGGDCIVGLVGEVRIWHGLLTEIPSGWALCDGVANPLNLVGKFIRGVNTDATDPGGTGGDNAPTLAETNLPVHGHTIIASSGSHFHYVQAGIGGGSGGVQGIINSITGHTQNLMQSDGAHTHTAPNAGESAALENRPSYLEEAFIIKV